MEQTTERGWDGRWPSARRTAGAALIAIGLIVAVPATALAEPPSIEEQLVKESVYSTRAHIAVKVRTGGVQDEWKGEYATSEAGPWTQAGGGTTEGTKTGFEPFQNFALGTLDATAANPEFAVLHHLLPETTYYARFHVWNAVQTNEATRTFHFTTAPVAKPELPGFAAHGGSSFKPSPFFVEVASPNSARAHAQVETNGAQTVYTFEYSKSEAGPWTVVPGCGGAITIEEDFADAGFLGKPPCQITGLSPETHYYVRLTASNEKGSVQEIRSVVTPTAKPVTDVKETRNITSTSVRLNGDVDPHSLATTWRFEYAPSAVGPWSAVPGGSGSISQTEAEALPPEGVSAPGIEATLSGLSPATEYYVRLMAENAAGEAQVCRFNFSEVQECEPVSSSASALRGFETGGAPIAYTFATHGVHGEALRLLGAANPNSSPIGCEYQVAVEGEPSSGTFTLAFKGFTTPPLPVGASAHEVDQALVGSGASLGVEGRDGGPYTVFCTGAEAGIEQPPLTADGSGLPAPATVKVVVEQQGGAGSHTSAHFEYVSQGQFEEPGAKGGFAQATSTSALDLGAGTSTRSTGQDLPADLEVGETYHYRLVAKSQAPGEPVADGPERTLVVPAPPSVEPAGSCPNEPLRSGPSGNLPDCRGYEQVTPVDKEGAQELYGYGGGVHNGALVGEDGSHAMVEASTVTWGAGPAAGGSPYFFSRGEGGLWPLHAGAVQPQTGVGILTPKLYDANLTRFAFEAGANTSVGGGESPNILFAVGSPGAPPYTEVASVPRGLVGPGGGWVASSKDFSKLILQLDDHTLLGSSTHTLTGADLYEYAGGELSQVNPGVGTCGAHIVSGEEEHGLAASAHAVSDDGSRVFFEAVPGKNCSQPSHLYVRIEGERTTDIGAYRFVAANQQGTQVLLERGAGNSHEFLLYDEAAGTVTPLFSSDGDIGSPIVSEGFAAFYFESQAQLTSDAPPPAGPSAAGANTTNLYRYDLAHNTLTFVVQTAPKSGNAFLSVTADGRYAYFESTAVSGLPGGSGATRQVYRYDSAQQVIECMSCASPTDPEPALDAVFPGVDQSTAEVGPESTWNGNPRVSIASDDGRFAFFDTPAALVTSDVDGEVAPEPEGSEHSSIDYSVSSDVYEWRADGVVGCAHAQGCLALITSGRGGFLNLLIGTANEGRDVFFYTLSQLGPSDNDGAGDIYDARIGGGSPPPPVQRPECEGDSCSAPFAAPTDATPSSLTFQGAGNPPSSIAPGPASKPVPKAKPKKVCRRSKHGCKSKRGPRKAAKRSARRRQNTSTRRAGG
jgi:hypothetical protein